MKNILHQYILAGTNESMARAVTSDVGYVLGSHVKSGVGKIIIIV